VGLCKNIEKWEKYVVTMKDVKKVVDEERATTFDGH